jgi:hypothetical protein
MSYRISSSDFGFDDSEALPAPRLSSAGLCSRLPVVVRVESVRAKPVGDVVEGECFNDTIEDRLDCGRGSSLSDRKTPESRSRGFVSSLDAFCWVGDATMLLL